jgi:hypothetical protein
MSNRLRIRLARIVPFTHRRRRPSDALSAEMCDLFRRLAPSSQRVYISLVRASVRARELRDAADRLVERGGAQ